MSFTSEIKDELFEKENEKSCCKTAEFACYINCLCAYSTDNIREGMVFACEDKRHAERVISLIRDLTGCEGQVYVNKKHICVKISESTAVLKILTLTGSFQGFDSESPINPKTVKKDCCKGAYLRTAFLINGFVTDPRKNYHMEFSDKEYAHAYGLKGLINSFGVSAKIIERKNHYVVYIKDSEQISDLLGIMSAHLSLLNLENIKVYKEVRNNINRKNNCETSNIAKTVKASVREQKAINFLMETGEFKKLSPKLKEAAEARLENPDLSYSELGELLNPPLRKSGIYHRLQKIVKIAEKVN
ncbi:MAG: DNA-binding protein WhiA [Clostridiales bacterium]|nr:DNA-binding protein WhiA [Clostridiales bacterium]